MRTIKQLLELMLAHQKLFKTGLCILADDLRLKNLISDDERKSLSDYIKANKPKNAGYIFYWEVCKIAPRIEWINQQIEKLCHKKI